MNAEGARQGAHRRPQPDSRPRYHGAATARNGWTAADAAELDALVYELARGYFVEHRKRCEACKPGACPAYVAWREHLDECPACQGAAPLTFAPPCPRRRQFIAHGANCPRCNPCPHVRNAIETVLEWREARELLSRAEWLRAERDRIGGRAA